MPNTVAEQAASASDNGAWLHVVAAVIRGEGGRILLARRPDDKHQGGKWEFPGGKVEAGEEAPDALVRELMEELGIGVPPASLLPLIEVRHRYPDKNIFLDVWETAQFSGEPYGREGQQVGWFAAPELAGMEFPAANLPIINRLLAP